MVDNRVMALLNATPLHRRSGPFLVLDFGQIQVQMQVEKVTVANLRTYLDAETARMSDLMRNIPPGFDRVIVIVDGSVALMPEYEARQLQADWIKAHKPTLQQLTHTVALVVPNPWVRAIVSAITSLAPLPVPMKTFPDTAAAIEWAIAESASLGGVVRDELLRERGAALERLRRVLS